MKTPSNFVVSDTPSLNNRALNYGDGCFSTMLSRKGHIQLLQHHVGRLMSDAKKLQILNNQTSFYASDVAALLKNFALHSYISSSENTKTEWQVVKLLIARGDSDRGYAPSLISAPVFVPSAQSYYPLMSSAIGLGLAKITLAEQPFLSGIKHLNRLEQVMAKIELSTHLGIDDLVLTNANGVMIELTASNLFYCIDGVWHTPSIGKSGVAGVMRQFILDYMQRKQICCTVSEMNVSALLSATAAFSCNAVTQVVPVSHIVFDEGVTHFDLGPSQDLAQQISADIALEKS